MKNGKIKGFSISLCPMGERVCTDVWVDRALISYTRTNTEAPRPSSRAIVVANVNETRTSSTPSEARREIQRFAARGPGV